MRQYPILSSLANDLPTMSYLDNIPLFELSDYLSKHGMPKRGRLGRLGVVAWLCTSF